MASCPTSSMSTPPAGSAAPSRRGPALRGSLIGRDCRLSSPDLAAALAEGATAVGADVTDIGLASTDLLYFASGSLDLPGIMLTASHNPPNYNGMKFCLAGARPVGQDTGLADLRELAAGPEPARADTAGSVEHRDLLDDYVEHVLTFVDVDAMRPLTVVIDTANGMGGLVVPRRPRPPAREAASPVPRARRHVPQPSRRSDRPREPARPEGGRPRASAPTSASRSTATPTGSSWSTSAPRASPGRSSRRSSRRRC